MTPSYSESVLECAACNKAWTARCSIQPGFSDWVDAKCPTCGAVLANLRCDWGEPDLQPYVEGSPTMTFFAFDEDEEIMGDDDFVED